MRFFPLRVQNFNLLGLDFFSFSGKALLHFFSCVWELLHKTLKKQKPQHLFFFSIAMEKQPCRNLHLFLIGFPCPASYSRGTVPVTQASRSGGSRACTRAGPSLSCPGKGSASPRGAELPHQGCEGLPQPQKHQERPV